MDLDLHDRVAIVTGAGRGLGRAAAAALVAEGVHVVAAARSSDELEKLAADHPDHVTTQTCDLADRDAVAALPQVALERHGRIDVLVNNAGIAPAGAFVDQDWDVWDKTFAVNVTAPAILCHHVGRHMLERGEGVILNIASTTGLRGKGGLAAYSSSKGAVLRLTEALAAEWTRHGVRVNAIAPGAFETRAQQAVLKDDDLMRRRLRRIPAGRMGDPAEFGAMVAYLASPQARFVSGSIHVIDGGEQGKL